MSKLVKEVRDDNGATLLNWRHQDMSKLDKEARVDRGDTSIKCSHETKCNVSNATKDDRVDTSVSWLYLSGISPQPRYKALNKVSEEKHDTSTSCSLQFDRSKLVKEVRVDRGDTSLN